MMAWLAPILVLWVLTFVGVIVLCLRARELDASHAERDELEARRRLYPTSSRTSAPGRYR